jgi:hypothetical protein
MASTKSYRPSAPLVINAIALFIVLGGQAIAISNRGVVHANDLAKGSVTAKNLAPGIVGTKKLAPHAVLGRAFRSEAVTGRTLASGAVHGETSAGSYAVPGSISDLDPAGPMGSDGNWTASDGTASCPPGALLIGGGLRMRDDPSHRAFLQSSFPSSSNLSTWVGEISTDTGGASFGQLYVACLR